MGLWPTSDPTCRTCRTENCASPDVGGQAGGLRCPSRDCSSVENLARSDDRPRLSLKKPCFSDPSDLIWSALYIARHRNSSSGRSRNVIHSREHSQRASEPHKQSDESTAYHRRVK